jgi:hypothetical protein
VPAGTLTVSCLRRGNSHRTLFVRAKEEPHLRLLFDIDCGRSVAVQALYYQRTYLSLLEGRPDREMNDRILEEARTEMTPLWGARRAHVISDPARARCWESRYPTTPTTQRLRPAFFASAR